MKDHAWGTQVFSFYQDAKKATPSLRTYRPALAWALALLVVIGMPGCVGYTGQTSPASGAITTSVSAVDFGSVNLGMQSTQTVDITNTGTAAVDISHVAISGTGFALASGAPSGSLGPGQTAIMQIKFAPTITGDISGGFSITSNAKNSPTKGSLKGKGSNAAPITLSASPSTVSFGTVNVGSNATQNVTLTNAGTGSIKITTVSATGTGFSVSGITLPYSLAAGASTSFAAQFAPAATGNLSGNISIAATNGSATMTATVALSGTGAQGALGVSPTTISFGTVNVGSSTTQNVTIANSGTGSASITAVSASGTGFSISGITLPYSLAAGASTTFTAKFAPAASGSATGSVSVSASLGSSTASATVALSGTGGQGSVSATPTTVTFGTVNVGSSATQNVTITNSGTGSASITAVSASGTGFSVSGITLPYSLAAGASTTFTAKFAPTATGSVTGSVSIAASLGSSNANSTVALNGTGAQPAISASPASVSFGSVVVGQSNSQPIKISNTGNASLTISQISVTGTGFSASGLAVPVTIQPGQSASFNVAFGPTSATAASGSVALASNAPNSPLAISLAGTGAAATYTMSVTPSSLAFGTVNLNSTASQTVALQNTGNSNITISSVGLSGAGFSASGISSGLILTPTQTANLTVTFSPTTAGSVSGAISIASNATSSPSVSLSGTGGTSTTSHSVALAWVASTSSGVVGYNVYRGTGSGSYSKINSSPVASTSYTDSTVQSGQSITYYYVVTAVNSTGTESTNSSSVSALVP